METKPGMNTVTIEMPEGDKGLFTVSSGYGFSVDAPAGASIRELLQKTLGLDADYIDNHIQTILHDGKPVDDIDNWKIARASTIALSGALPGLFGAAFRKGGEYAALRPGEMQAEDAAPSKKGTIRITVKLFNLTARQLGPKLLEKGARMPAESFRSLWKNILKLDTDRSLRVFLDGNKTDPESLMESIGSEQVHLFVHLLE